MPTAFRNRLLAGERLLGTLISLPSPEITEILAAAGFDWLFIDGEHGPFDALQMQTMLQAAGVNCPCVVRVPAGEEIWIKKALDIGAAGVIVPHVNTASDAEHVVRLCKYPPVGTRSVGSARANGYGVRSPEYQSRANEDIAVIVQAEHIDAVRNIASISQIKGIDAVFVGPYDLSASMGKIGQVTDPEVRSAIGNVRDMCLEAGVRLGIFGASAEAVKPYLAQGFTLIAVGTDSTFLHQTARATLRLLQN